MTPTSSDGLFCPAVTVLVATIPVTLGHVFTCMLSAHRTAVQEKGVILQKDAREHTCKVYLWAWVSVLWDLMSVLQACAKCCLQTRAIRPQHTGICPDRCLPRSECVAETSLGKLSQRGIFVFSVWSEIHPHILLRGFGPLPGSSARVHQWKWERNTKSQPTEGFQGTGTGCYTLCPCWSWWRFLGLDCLNSPSGCSLNEKNSTITSVTLLKNRTWM